jgi:hypothetical protein
MHSFAQVHALSIDLCKNHHRKLPVTCACRFGQVRALSHGRSCLRGPAAWGGGGTNSVQRSADRYALRAVPVGSGA